MPTIKKILFPVDLSAGSKKVALYVKEFADKFDAEVHVIYVAHVASYYSSLEVPSAGLMHFETEVINAAEVQLKDFMEKNFKDLPVKTDIITGNPGEKIIDYARSENMDLIIVGHSRVGVERLILGSVAGHLVKWSPIPVMVIRLRDEE